MMSGHNDSNQHGSTADSTSIHCSDRHHCWPILPVCEGHGITCDGEPSKRKKSSVSPLFRHTYSSRKREATESDTTHLHLERQLQDEPATHSLNLERVFLYFTPKAANGIPDSEWSYLPALMERTKHIVS